MKKAKILIVDDHPIVRNGLKSLLSRNPDYLQVGEAVNGEEAYKKVLELKPDIVVLDIVMPRLGGIQVAERIKKFHPKTKIIILSMYKQKEYALCALRAGVDGFVLKDQASERLLDALNSVKAGKRYICPDVARYLAEEYIQFTKNNTLDPFYSLSLREKEVLSLIVEGNTSKKIAKQLNISLSTIKTHRHSIMRKLNIHDVASLIRLAMQKGFDTIAG